MNRTGELKKSLMRPCACVMHQRHRRSLQHMLLQQRQQHFFLKKRKKKSIDLNPPSQPPTLILCRPQANMLACFHLVNTALAAVKGLLDNLRGPLLQFVSSARRKCNGPPAAVSHPLMVAIKAWDALFGFSPHRDRIFSSSVVRIDSHTSIL